MTTDDDNDDDVDDDNDDDDDDDDDLWEGRGLWPNLDILNRSQRSVSNFRPEEDQWLTL